MLARSIIHALVGAVLTAALAAAAPVYGTSVQVADWTGQRTLTSGGGLNSYGQGPGWTFPQGSGISWVITFDSLTSMYTYSYTLFTTGRNGAEPLEVSHFILELSPGCIVEGWSDCISGFQGDTEFRSNWNSSGPGSSNPGMPASIYGVKFDEELATYTFVSDRIPVWGNFYAKKGNDGLWNLGLEPAYAASDNVIHFIPRPDTDSEMGVIPEPGTMMLLGAGMAALGLLRRRKG